MTLTITLASLARGQTLEVLHSFNGIDGYHPLSELIQATDGNFYGTTINGGENNEGTVFRFATSSGLTTLVSFNDENGSRPKAALIQTTDRNIYGMTRDGGVHGAGTIFRLSLEGALTTVYEFDSTFESGFAPEGGLLEWHDGKLYGTTPRGGTNSSGTVFRVTANGDYTTLVNFEFDGFQEPRVLVLGVDNNFYGTTDRNGTNGGHGMVFRMTPQGGLTPLVTFNGFNGHSPQSLLATQEGVFYGATARGGMIENEASNFGTVFRISADGILTTIFSFQGTNGSNPYGKMIQGNDGCLYGITWQGGESNLGTVFRTTTSGALQTLVTFDGANGAEPRAGLLQATDGNLYGTTSLGGANNKGTIFRIVIPVDLNSRVSGNQLILSWPTNALGFTLQSASDLNSSTNWIDCTNASVVIGAQFTVTNLISDTRFFRLKKP